jgi:signal transduction histidine kinase
VSESPRVAEARVSGEQRVRRERRALRPLGWAVLAVVAAGTFDAEPHPGLHGKALAVTLALCAFGGALALTVTDRPVANGAALQVGVLVLMAGTAVALSALQPHGATAVAAGATVWMAFTRLPFAAALAIACATTAGLDLAVALSGSSAAVVLAATLLCALLGLIARFTRLTRESQARTAVLLAELEDARDEQMRAAAIEERGRIAAELHDVLAHSLSGAAIQLQSARKLAEREEASDRTRAAIDRASELVTDGLGNARQAVGALRGDRLPGVADLASLVHGFRDDMDADVTLTVEGTPRPLPVNADLALYRGAQEALTNVGRYASGAATRVVLRYEPERATLSIENGAPPGRSALPGVGGGRGLAGLRERADRAGGTMHAGPTGAGWRVELDVPA